MALSSYHHDFDPVIVSSNPMNNGNTTSNSSFCEGMPVTMFLDGFHWALVGHHGNGAQLRRDVYHDSLPRQPPQQCLNYLVGSWLLSNPTQFRGAMIFTFVLAVVMEAMSAFRGWVVASQPRGRLRSLFLIIIYLFQTLWGYIIMIVAMTYSLELVLSVAVGLAVGHLLFVRLLPPLEDEEQKWMPLSRPTVERRSPDNLSTQDEDDSNNEETALPYRPSREQDAGQNL